MKSKLLLGLIFFALLALTSNKFYTQQEKTEIIAFVDDFNENSSLEPDYYKYFKEISEDSLLGKYKYERFNVNIEMKDNNTDEKVNVDHADIVVLMMGTANTVINTLDSSNELSPEDFLEEYKSFISELIEKDKKVFILSPPPYKTISKYEDEAIINNLNTLEKLSGESDNLVFVDLFSFVKNKYDLKKISHGELSSLIVSLLNETDSKLAKN